MRLTPKIKILSLAIAVGIALQGAAEARQREPGLVPLGGAYFGSFTLNDPNPLPFTTFPVLITFHSDGTVVETDGAELVDSPPGQRPNFSSPGHGVWQQAGPRTYSFKFISLSVGPDGTTVFTLVVSGTVDVAHDGSLHGATQYQAYDANGTAIDGLGGSATLQAVRITL